FKCSPPLAPGGGPDKSITTYCEKRKNVNWILYENVTPNISMVDYVKQAEPVKFLDKMFQLALACRLAHRYCDFTHWDLHPGNVLIRYVSGMQDSPTILLPFPRKGGEIFLKTGGVASIIDYGSAHISYEGRAFGNNQYIE